MQPLVFFKSPLGEREAQMVEASVEFGEYFDRQYERIREGFDELNDRHAGDNRCNFIDVSEIYKDYEGEIFTDYIHVNDEGNSYTASRLYEHILSIYSQGLAEQE